MAANDEFPRGWTLTSRAVGAGQVASIIVPAVAGVTHVLDTVIARLLGTPGGGGAEFTVLNGAIVLADLYIAVPGVDETVLTDVGMSAAVGAALQVNFNAVSVAGVNQFLVIQGHDI